MRDILSNFPAFQDVNDSLYSFHIMNSYKSCTCNEGFLVDENSQCQDIDECVFIRQFVGRQMMRSLGFSTATCTANSDCVNTVGSYFCQCLPGFEEISGPFGSTCESIECNEGFQVNLTNNQCENIDECQLR